MVPVKRMPQTLPSAFPERPAEFGPTFVDVPRTDTLRTADNPVGRTVAELEMMLAPLLAGHDGDAELDGPHIWPMGRTILFILLSCGLFWTGAVLAVWSWL
jgi:hypothetical protein